MASFFVVGSRSLEHRSEDAEPPFHDASSHVGGKLRKVRPITTPRSGDGGGPDARSRAIQALAALVSSCHATAVFAGMLSYCLTEWLAISRRNGISGPTGMYS